MSIGECTWEAATGNAVLSIANRATEPMHAKIDVIFGSARRNDSPDEIHPAVTYPREGDSWLLPPAGLPEANQPDYDPGWTIRMQPPDDADNGRITWCYATIAEVSST